MSLLGEGGSLAHRVADMPGGFFRHVVPLAADATQLGVATTTEFVYDARSARTRRYTLQDWVRPGARARNSTC